jgi:very-short-patch-repair endonuclease/Zn-finger protein
VLIGNNFSQLYFICNIVVLNGASKRGLYICKCGRVTSKFVKDVDNRHVKSCGRCNYFSKEEMATKVINGLIMDPPMACSSGSGEKHEWKCHCGKKFKPKTCNVFNEHTKSCGRCNYFSKEEMATKVINGLMMDPPMACSSGSDKKVWWKCHCGKRFKTHIYNVFVGKTKSCGHCSVLSKEYMMTAEFGHLMQHEPKNTMPRSHKEDLWNCDCGMVTSKIIFNVTRRHTTSCGDCSRIVKQWYNISETKIRQMKTPIDPCDLPGCPIVFLDTITHTKKAVPALCPACKKEYHPRWEDIRLGKSLTCGCRSSRISRQAVMISEFIKLVGFKTEFEHKVNKLAYDIFVPSKNLLIEYDGTHWHDDSSESLKMEIRKENNATDSGYKFLRIKENEWRKDRPHVEELIRTMLVDIC